MERRKSLQYMAICFLCLGAGPGRDAHADSAVQRAIGTIEVHDDASDSAVVTAQTLPADGLLGVSYGLFDDMALPQSRVVHYCDLGLVIRNQDAGEVSVLVHDARGRAVVTQQFASGSALLHIDLHDVTRGVYVYTVKMADSVYTRPFVITR